MRKNWIVVVDDDIVVLKNINNLLSGEDMNVSSVRSGRELLTFIKKNNPDLILLDVMMPEMDGFEAFRKLREFEDAENRNHVPVVFLTGDADSDVEMQGLKIGASDFIRKPVKKDILVSRIRNIISSTKAIENLTEEAMTDGLTGFYNKSFVSSKMRELCKKGEGTLMVLDLDNFKPVNDIYGHDTGDVVLKKFAYLIKDGCDDNDVLCRIGGDEFLVLTREEMTKEKIAAFSTKLNTRIVEECVDIMGKDFNVPIGVSSGVISLTHSKEYDTLFKLADKELYRVKQNGKHGYGVFDPDKQNNDEELISAQTALDRMNILCAERGESDCAMVVGQDSFISISRFMDRYVRINKESFIRLVFSVFTDDVSDRDEAVVLFQSVIENTFSKNDVVMKDNTDCFYLILPKHDASDMDNIIKRVMDNWEQTRFFDSTRIDYAYEVVKYKE